VREIRGDADLANKLVVVTSGRDVADEAEDAGADLFMLKPFSPNELSARLSGLLAESRSS
jgi:DNA-binding response OmpR family regulator